MWVKPSQSKVYRSHDEIRRDSITSFPEVITDSMLEPFGIFPVVQVPPSYDSITHGTIEQFPVQVNGVWTQQFSIVARTPEESAAKLLATKMAKNDEINAARLKANRSTFTHSGKVFACDELSRSDIDGINGYVALYNAFPAGWPGGWKAVDNTYLPITDIAAWKAFYASMVAHGNLNFAHAQTLKAALLSATTAEQIAAIVW